MADADAAVTSVMATRTAVLKRLARTKDAYEDWLEHMRDCPACREEPPLAVRRRRRDIETVEGYDNVLAVLREARDG